MRVSERLIIEHILKPRGLTIRGFLAHAAKEGWSDLWIQKNMGIPRHLVRRWKEDEGLVVEHIPHFTKEAAER